MSEAIQAIKMKYWLVSYDNQPEIKKMYRSVRHFEYKLHYHISKPTQGSEVIFFSNNLVVPEIKNPIRMKKAHRKLG